VCHRYPATSRTGRTREEGLIALAVFVLELVVQHRVAA
jgi:hypothetical protein